MSVEGWKKVRISEFGVIVTGSTPDTKNSSYWDGDIPFVSPADFNSSTFVVKTYKNLTDEGAKRARIVPKNSILVTCIGSIGGISIAPWDCVTNQQINSIICSDDFDNIFVYLLIQNNLHRLVELAGITTLPIINKRTFGDIELFCPNSVSEQTQIATILSTIDRAIEQTEALITKQQRIKTGLMQDLLTKGIDENGNIRSEETHEFKDSPLGRIPVEWEVKKIEQKLERIIDYRGQTPKKVTEGIPLLTAKNVRDGFIEKEPQEFIADSAYNSWMSRGIPEVGDVLFTTEAPMGNVASIPNYRIALAQRLLTLCPKINELSQDFLFWILHWKRSKERIELLTSGSTVVGIKQSVFRKVIFAFPSYNEQERIYAVLNSHDEINKNEKHKLKKLQRLKTGLMQDLLTGKVRVTDLLNQKTATN
ncbi:MAG: restriction endonuclease subunit S [Microcystis sp. LE19-10.1B]|uniref:restriction endonuclease subunit S n=1 Tax=Microcystis sp. LE19-10.1B TaxID=3016428 RepID=UPI0022BBF2D3|nr:restriction endonuclease subunit S [Microcystis sp. LE19-10.1B]MCZ8025257.1 restriction endonuclease subunit S [Microcystis sp. LE19-10.1B]MCZ8365580.1 restriction endonuclease subunit S [Microcystis sp. LE19-251.1A]